MDLEEKKKFVDAFFGIIEEADVKNLAEVPEKDNGGSGDVSSDNVTSNPTSENKKEEKKGCSSVTGGLAYGMVAFVAVAGLLFKKKED